MSDNKQLSHAKEPVCGDCVHCMPGPNTQNNLMSRNCYRYPPVAIGVQMQGQLAVVSVRPEISVTTIACGEYEEPDDEIPSAGLTS